MLVRLWGRLGARDQKKESAYSDGQEESSSRMYVKQGVQYPLAVPNFGGRILTITNDIAQNTPKTDSKHTWKEQAQYAAQTCLFNSDEFSLLTDIVIIPYASRWRRLSLKFKLKDDGRGGRGGRPGWNGMRILPLETNLTGQTVSFDNLEMLDIYSPHAISDTPNVFGAMGMRRKLSALRTSQLLIYRSTSSIYPYSTSRISAMKDSQSFLVCQQPPNQIDIDGVLCTSTGVPLPLQCRDKGEPASCPYVKYTAGLVGGYVSVFENTFLTDCPLDEFLEPDCLLP